jgi:hypothetical protein
MASNWESICLILKCGGMERWLLKFVFFFSKTISHKHIFNTIFYFFYYFYEKDMEKRNYVHH